jgi:hypothetical protein
LGAVALIACLRMGDEEVMKKPAFATRLGAMPDMMDRVRIAGVVALAAFTALALALLSHFALAGDPLTLPGLHGGGEVLTTPAEHPALPALSRTVAPVPTVSTSGSPSGIAPLSGGGSTGAGEAPPRQAGAPKSSGSGPRTVGVSVGSAAPSAPAAAAPQAPSSGSSTPSGTGSSGTAGTGGPQQDPTTSPTTTQPPSPANNWNHSPVGPAAGSTSSTSGRTGSASSAGTSSTHASAGSATPSTGSATSVAKPGSKTTSTTAGTTTVAGKVKSSGSSH